eukprot:Protomagalhaensia_sp_Gyna_25__50@NODE_1023_length_2277_cov_67_408847_g815_i0_p1_GENE_NODE_1023_length_2277_cov_67_408847_g815_i0NODE_1023_length_2277_cov_67_408847_g815_i0_p1_ORF_typecomplete_len394_score54_92ANAPC4_WD40/PF12894_7/90ANAPC4_WD40/PF12894_7/0_036ANAPC4_WD40/PF12894_7/0_0067ANAPC4_WD40/PF12894_7/4_1e08ANAPC4_WD40/PF12894_7/12WD40/PF00400_32/16WD40/PF00400_32/0_00022WD40/PF00400_32/0_61WD40/PF00400_32/0_2WD40/PF00400_32/0_025WD40/PF00400_32/14WD40_like/PF17005_5/1_8e03WD40_like/PF170
MSELGRLPDFFWENPGTDVENPAVYSCAPIYAPDGRVYLATGGGDEILRILELVPDSAPAPVPEVQPEEEEEDGGDANDSFKILKEFTGFSESITRCALSADRSMLAAASLDGRVVIYKLKLEDSESALQVTPFQLFDGPTGEIEECVWSPQGQMILATTGDGMAWLWHATKGYHGVLVGHAKAVPFGAFIYCEVNGQRVINVVTASIDGSVIIWDPVSLTARHKVVLSEPGGELRPITSMAVHSSEPLIACGTGDGTVYLIQGSNGQVIRSVQVMECEVGVVEFAPEVTRREIGDVQLAVAADSVVKILDCSSFAVRQVLEDPLLTETFAINHVRWAPAWPPTLVTASEDGMIR